MARSWAFRLALRRKERPELAFWMIKRAREGSLGNVGYRVRFTEGFGLDQALFQGKRMLDVGCGPRGSLERATGAAERVGLDPLASSYLRLGADSHQTSYVEGEIEDPPVPIDHFDIVSSINSLDHVNDLQRAIDGLYAVLRPWGTPLLLTDLNHRPRVTEPQDFSWGVVDRFTQRGFEVVGRLDLEKVDEGFLSNVRAGVEFDHGDPRPRPGILRLILQKPD